MDEAPEVGRADPFADGVSRRRLLRSSGAVGAATALAGCLDDAPEGERAPTVFAFNTGDRTVTVIDAETDEAVDTVHLGTTSSFPANQYGSEADSDYDVLWLNVSGGVRAIGQHGLDELAHADLELGPTYPNLSPDEDHLVVAAGGTTTLDPDPGEPVTHRIARVDADRESDTFGEVTGEIETDHTGPCDVTMGPGGEYCYVAEINAERLRVVRIDPFETVARIDVGEPAGEGRVLPFMCTASFDGEYLLVENGEGELGPDPEVPRRGSESVWDISDPETPEEVAKITREDGLPAMPITSEVDPDTEFAYLFTPGEGVTVIDVVDREVDRVLDVGGDALAGAWGPNREKLYVPVQDAGHVAVIDHGQREVVATPGAGEAPTGAVGGMVRPDPDHLDRVAASVAALGVRVGDAEPTHCLDDYCYCGWSGGNQK